MIVLDTNVISEVIRHTPAPEVISWLDSVATAEVMTTAITAAELLYGVARLPQGRRKLQFAAAVQGVLDEDFPGRVLSFDEHAAGHYAEVVAARDRLGRPMGVADAQIAAICHSVNAVLATRNIADFEETGLDLIDPWNLS